MNVLTSIEQERSRSIQGRTWDLASRIAFRFCFVYLGMYCLASQIFTLAFFAFNLDLPTLGTLPPLRLMAFWFAEHVFHTKTLPDYTNTSSSDKTYDWILICCLLLIAVAATGIWTILDRKRQNYVFVGLWLRLFLRYCLAGQMFMYGISKLLLVQMPFPDLFTQIQPLGNLSQMGVLWASVGASPTYEMIGGCAEIVGGLLLLPARTVTLGAIICLFDMTGVLILNVSYRLPVKLLSFHLLLLCVLLVTPDLRALMDLLVMRRTAEPSPPMPLFRTRRANRVAITIQALLWIWMMATISFSWSKIWPMIYGTSAKSTLYGIWDLEQVTIDGQVHPPLLTDEQRWRRVIFDNPQTMQVQCMDDSRVDYGSTVDVQNKTVVLTRRGDDNWKAPFNYRRMAENRMIFEGVLDGHIMSLQMHLLDRTKFPIANRGSQWVSE